MFHKHLIISSCWDKDDDMLNKLRKTKRTISKHQQLDNQGNLPFLLAILHKHCTGSFLGARSNAGIICQQNKNGN